MKLSQKRNLSHQENTKQKKQATVKAIYKMSRCVTSSRLMIQIDIREAGATSQPCSSMICSDNILKINCGITMDFRGFKLCHCCLTTNFVKIFRTDALKNTSVLLFNQISYVNY